MHVGPRAERAAAGGGEQPAAGSLLKASGLRQQLEGLPRTPPPVPRGLCEDGPGRAARTAMPSASALPSPGGRVSNLANLVKSRAFPWSPRHTLISFQETLIETLCWVVHGREEERNAEEIAVLKKVPGITKLASFT